MMFLVLDQGIPLGAATILRTGGIECTHVSEMAMARAEDSIILHWSRENHGTVVTLDADFHGLRCYYVSARNTANTAVTAVVSATLRASERRR